MASSVVIALGIFAVAVAAPALSRRLTGDYLSPPAIVLLSWGTSLGLFALKLLPYPPLHLQTRLVIFGCVVILVAASAASIWCWRRAPLKQTIALPRADFWVTLFGFIGLAGVLWFALSVIAELGPRGFADAEALRFALFTKRIPSAFLFAQLFAVVTPLVALALVLGGTRLPRLAIGLAVLCGLSTLLTTDRTQFFTLLLSAMFMVGHRMGTSLSWRRASVIGAAAAVLLVSSFIAIETWRRASDRGLFLQLPGMTWVPGTGAVGPGESGLLPAAGRAGQRFAVMYAYTTGSYAALDRLLKAREPLSWGAHTFYPVLRFLQRARLLNITLPSAIPEYVELYSPPAPGLVALTFNAYTFLYYPLRDFGIVGALAYAAFVGFAAGFVYVWARADRADPLRLLLYGHVATALTLTVLVNKFNNTAWWYLLVMSTLPWTGRLLVEMLRSASGRSRQVV